MGKPRLGVFSVTGCFGCQLSLAFVEDVLLEILNKFEVVAFPMLKENNEVKDIDVAFIEGSAVRAEEIEELKKIRDNSKMVVALGACACNGGVQTIKELGDKAKIAAVVYGNNAKVYSPVDAGPIEKHIKVDYYIGGCPPDKQNLVMFVKDVLVGKKNPIQIDMPVCVECRMKGNVCLLQEGKPCMGPFTYAGCNALCPSNGHYCFGCHGVWADANGSALRDLFKEHGFSDIEIKQFFAKFACTNEKVQKVVK
ncbi:MAG: sulfhydrogenase 1 subunit delta [Candidatus Woesearchaeota archaeon]